MALQLTNILRDVREDYLNGRVYLPAEDLAKFGIEFAPFGQPEPFPAEATQARFASLVEFEAARAREWYASGMRLLATIDRRSAACTGAMAGIYRRLLERIARQPSAVLEGRMSLPAGEKALEFYACSRNIPTGNRVRRIRRYEWRGTSIGNCD